MLSYRRWPLTKRYRPSNWSVPIRPFRMKRIFSSEIFRFTFTTTFWSITIPSPTSIRPFRIGRSPTIGSIFKFIRSTIKSNENSFSTICSSNLLRQRTSRWSLRRKISANIWPIRWRWSPEIRYVSDRIDLNIGRRFGKGENRRERMEMVGKMMIRSLKFHSNSHVAIETEFYYSKGFFPIAFDRTFQKIEILGEIFQGIPLKMILLLPRFSLSMDRFVPIVRLQMFVGFGPSLREYRRISASTDVFGVHRRLSSSDFHRQWFESRWNLEILLRCDEQRASQPSRRI